jgi:hypothetical protein
VKTKIALFPVFEFEAGISVFLDFERFSLVPLRFDDSKVTEKYGQKVFGEWCFPLKLAVAAVEKAVVEDGVRAVFSIAPEMCRYPLALGNIRRWIEADFDYYTVQMESAYLSLKYFKNLYLQLKKLLGSLGMLRYLATLPFAFWKIRLARKMEKCLYQYLPLVNNPLWLRQQFEIKRARFLATNKRSELKALVREFEKLAKAAQVKEEPIKKLLISGDFSVIAIDFPIFDLPLFLAKHSVQIVQTYSVLTARSLKSGSRYAKRAKKLISKVISNQHHQSKPSSFHLLEVMTIALTLKGREEGVDGVLFIKPNMCAPCENLSFILKENNNLDLPILELSYDAHSGSNGIITRLEAFLHILKERG